MSDAPYGPGQVLWVLVIVLTAVGFGLVPVFARWLSSAGLDPAAIAFYRYSLTALVTLPFLGLRFSKLGFTLLGMVAGAAMGLGWIGYVMAVERTSVSTAGVLYMTYPLFTVLFAWMLLGHWPGMRGVLAAGMVACAAWLTLTPDVLDQLSWQGAVFALAAPLSFGFAITVLTGWLKRLSPIERLACVPLGACLALAPVMLQKPMEAILPVPEDWMLVAGIAAATSLVPGFLYVIAAPRVGPVRTAIAGSFELPVMIYLGWRIFGERIPESEIAATVLVIAAILVVSVSHQPKGRPPAT